MSARSRAGRNLSCTAQRPEAVWPLHDVRWNADSVIESIDAVRRSMRVPFYIYELPGIMRVEEGLDLLDLNCDAQSTTQTYDSAEHHFLRALVPHPWRTRDAGAAQLLIVPLFMGWENRKRCPEGVRRPTPAKLVMRAINSTATWQQRRLDHLFVCLDWASSGKPLLPRAPIMRVYVEARWSEPMTRGYLPREPWQNYSRPDRSSNFLLVAPYVDNGGPAATESERRVRWRSSERNLSFFWGGAASRRVGPGRTHMGYYVRWHMLEQWAKEPAAFDEQVVPAPHPLAPTHSTLHISRSS